MTALGHGEQPREPRDRYELAGPDTVSYAGMVELALRSFQRRRPLVRVPLGVARRGLRMVEAVAGQRAFASWDEAELLQVPMTSRRGTADAERLGVTPQPLRAVLGTA
jgi:hypothetical protein